MLHDDTKQLSEQDSISQQFITEADQLLKLNYETFRNERFIKGIFCPHCLNTTGKTVCNYVRFGLVNGTAWQRYRCKQCQRIFSDLTRTFFHRSRNVQKWPLFIKLVMVDKLPLKQIAINLGLHFNTIYAWKKKLTMFFELYLPNKQFHPTSKDSYDYESLPLNCSSKGATPKQNTPQDQHVHVETNSPQISVTIAVNRENPSHILFNVQEGHNNINNGSPKSRSTNLSMAIQDFQSFLIKKRGISARNLSTHLTFFRMQKLVEAINPVILPGELIKICLDKDHLLRSNRLLKRLI